MHICCIIVSIEITPPLFILLFKYILTQEVVISIFYFKNSILILHYLEFDQDFFKNETIRRQHQGYYMYPRCCRINFGFYSSTLVDKEPFYFYTYFYCSNSKSPSKSSYSK